MIIIYCQICDAKLESLLDYENHMRDHENSVDEERDFDE